MCVNLQNIYETALFSEKIYTNKKNFTRPPVATVATNSKSGPGVLNLLRYFGIYFLLLKTSRNAMKQNINEGRCYFLPFVDVIIPISSI